MSKACEGIGSTLGIQSMFCRPGKRYRICGSDFGTSIATEAAGQVTIMFANMTVQ